MAATTTTTTTAPTGHVRVRSFPDWNSRLRAFLPRTTTTTRTKHSRVKSLTSPPLDHRGQPSPLTASSAPSLAEMAATVAPPPALAPTYPLTTTMGEIRHGSISAVSAPSRDHFSSTAPDRWERKLTPPASDAGTEVTALSNKLIAAINDQTSLEDALAAARLELERSKESAQRLQSLNQEHDQALADGTLVQRAEMEEENAQLQESLEAERQRRIVVEKERISIEQELETLTTALFEEANQMVAAARHERDVTERKNEQLRAQLKDAETLLASHQEQLAELKTVMQQMSSDKDENETNLSTTPTTPLLATGGTNDQLGKMLDAMHRAGPPPPGFDDMSPPPHPSYPTSFAHLLHPVLRHDLPAYQDFTALLKTSRDNSPRHRSMTGPYGGLSLAGLASLRDSSPWHTSSPSPLNHNHGNNDPGDDDHHRGSSSTVATNGGGSQVSSPVAPSTPTLSSTPSYPAVKDAVVVPLKETRFYKRVLLEDIEPTLRLDVAPGLSWLARRTVAASMSEGNLVVEPLPATPSIRPITCALCGERRRGEQYARAHQLKANDHENAQRYPLCRYCTGRVRATCDFLGFLRMVKDGHWRTDGDEGEKSAWEESVRLRDRMFWARIGGGVLPTSLHRSPSPSSPSPHLPPSSKESPRPSSAEEGDVNDDHRRGGVDAKVEKIVSIEIPP